MYIIYTSIWKWMRFHRKYIIENQHFIFLSSLIKKSDPGRSQNTSAKINYNN